MTEPTARIDEHSEMRLSMEANSETVVIPLSEISEEEAIEVESRHGLESTI